MSIRPIWKPRLPSLNPTWRVTRPGRSWTTSPVWETSLSPWSLAPIIHCSSYVFRSCTRCRIRSGWSISSVSFQILQGFDFSVFNRKSIFFYTPPQKKKYIHLIIVGCYIALFTPKGFSTRQRFYPWSFGPIIHSSNHLNSPGSILQICTTRLNPSDLSNMPNYLSQPLPPPGASKVNMMLMLPEIDQRKERMMDILEDKVN